MGTELFRLFRPADLLILPLLVLIVLLGARGEGVGSAIVIVHGLDCELRLSASTDTTMTVDGRMGPLTLEIQGGMVRITDSPCPGQDCVIQGWISTPGVPLVCIPSGVYVLLEASGDDRTGVDAVSY